MKKTNKLGNKGFSLVELIIVIAILAILAGALAPALLRYLDKSKQSNDNTAAKTIQTAAENAMAEEAISDAVMTVSGAYCYYVPGTGVDTNIANLKSEIEASVAPAKAKLTSKKFNNGKFVIIFDVASGVTCKPLDSTGKDIDGKTVAELGGTSELK